MNKLLELAVLGIYLPIILFSGASCWLFISRLIIPAWKAGRLDVQHYAVGVSAVFALAAHFAENVWYGSARWFGKFEAMNHQLLAVGAWKFLILCSTVFAVAALQAGHSDKRTLGRVVFWALLCWVFGVIASAAFL